MWCKKKEDILKIECIIDEKGDYYGWLENEEISMIYSNIVQFKVCFPYGYKVLEEQGRGKMVKLIIKEL